MAALPGSLIFELVVNKPGRATCVPGCAGAALAAAALPWRTSPPPGMA